MISRFAVIATLLGATTLLPATAHADVPPADSCATPGSACNTAPPDYKSPGTCTTTTCTKQNFQDGGTYEYPCDLCVAGGSGTGGTTGGAGASATGGSAGAKSGGGGGDDDGGCTLASAPARGAFGLAALALVGLAAGLRRRRA